MAVGAMQTFMVLAGVVLLGSPVRADIKGCEVGEEVQGPNTPNITIKCNILKDWVVISAETTEDFEVHIRRRDPKQDSKSMCLNVDGARRLDEKNVTFICFYQGLLILETAQTATNTGDYFVFDPNSGKKFHTFPSRVDIPKFDENGVTFWDEVRRLEHEKCPPEHTQGFGCKELELVTLNLKTGKKLRSGKKKYSMNE